MAPILECQKTRLIDLISIHYKRLFKRSLKRNEVQYRSSTWNEIVNDVNSLGAVKTLEQWKKSWAQMKKSANDKILFIQQYRKRTGRQENCPIKLNANEEAVISIINDGLSVDELLRINESIASVSEFASQQPVETITTASVQMPMLIDERQVTPRSSRIRSRLLSPLNFDRRASTCGRQLFPNSTSTMQHSTTQKTASANSKEQPRFDSIRDEIAYAEGLARQSSKKFCRSRPNDSSNGRPTQPSNMRHHPSVNANSKEQPRFDSIRNEIAYAESLARQRSRSSKKCCKIRQNDSSNGRPTQSSNMRHHHSSSSHHRSSNTHHFSNNLHHSSNSRRHQSSNNHRHSHNNHHHSRKQHSPNNRHGNRDLRCTSSNHGNEHCRCAPSMRKCGICYLPISVSSEQDNTNRIVADMCEKQVALFDQVKLCLSEIRKFRASDSRIEFD